MKQPIFSRNSPDRLTELKKLFQDHEGNFIVRGSFARGDELCNDIDVAIYNYGGLADITSLPKTFQGIPINYWVIPLEELDQYLEICIRPSISLVETKLLKITTAKAAEIIKRQQKKFYQQRANNYLLYVLLEEEVSSRLYEPFSEDSYSFRKRQRGSKRTISRIVWAAKARWTELWDKNTNQVLSWLSLHAIMPEDIRDSSYEVLRLLFEKNIDEKKWATLTNKINHWYQTQYRPMILSYLQTKLPAGFIRDILLTVDNAASQEELGNVYQRARSMERRSAQWMIYFGLSSHTKLKEDQLIAIFQETKDSIIYNNIVRNLIANINFPEGFLPMEMIRNNSLYNRAYEIRKKLTLKQ